jgi:hypothetical protein
MLQVRGWGLVVADPEELYDRTYGAELKEIRAKLDAIWKPKDPRAPRQPPIRQTNLPKIYLLGAVRFYQVAISPADGASCGLYPTCSGYAMQCLRKHGAVVGFVMPRVSDARPIYELYSPRSRVASGATSTRARRPVHHDHDQCWNG